MTARISIEEARRIAGKPGACAIVPGKRHFAQGRLPPGTMNKTEARYLAEVIKPAEQARLILWWAFEAVKLRLAPSTFLTVDFFILPASGILEAVDVKGAVVVIEEDARVKMKVAADKFPFLFRFAVPRPRRDGGGWLHEDIGR